MEQQALIRQREEELNRIYNPQVQLLEQQIQALPGQFQGQRSSLEQARINAFRDIGSQAQRRGMFFSGFQPAEQARFLGERYLPGLQDITARQEQARLGLLGQITGLRGQQAETRAQFLEQLRQEQVARQEQLRREQVAREAEERERAFAAEQARLQRAASTSGRGSGLSVADQIRIAEFEQEQAENQPRMFIRGTSGGSSQFGFTDRQGNPISAARYAELTGQDIRDVLAEMGAQGDTYAQQVYNKLRRDPNPQQRLGQYKTAYSPLFWGT